jgi:hypothetical protein
MQALTEFPFKTGRCALLSRGQPLSVIYGGLEQESPNKNAVSRQISALLSEQKRRSGCGFPFPRALMQPGIFSGIVNTFDVRESAPALVF